MPQHTQVAQTPHRAVLSAQGKEQLRHLQVRMDAQERECMAEELVCVVLAAAPLLLKVLQLFGNKCSLNPGMSLFIVPSIGQLKHLIKVFSLHPVPGSMK